jgi:hypothetical protein
MGGKGLMAVRYGAGVIHQENGELGEGETPGAW